MYYIDTHSHLYVKEYREDIEEVVRRSLDASVRRIVLADTDRTARESIAELTDRYPDVMSAAIGMHPTCIDEDYRDDLSDFVRRLGTRPYCAIGECGIDLYEDTKWAREQVKVFDYQLGVAEDAKLPVLIHARNAKGNREATEKVFELLEKHPAVTGILHCFSGTEEDARRAIDRGFLLGIGGIVTFKNADLPVTVRAVGAAHLVLETDAPFLSPTPFRGKRNESAHIPLIAQKIADVLETDVKNIARTTTQNAEVLFNLQPCGEVAEG